MPGGARLAVAVAVVSWTLLWLGSDVRAQTPQAAADRVQVQRDSAVRLTRITIQGRDGQVALADVVCGIARAVGLDDSALTGTLPDAALPISGRRAAWQLMICNVCLPAGIQLDIERPPDEKGPRQLVITVDRDALQASRRSLKKRLRVAALKILASRSTDRRRYGLRLDSGCEELPRDWNLVVLVHGMNSNSQASQRLLDAPRKAGYPCGVFDYPDDQAIADSARLLADELARFSRQQPDRKISLITHSMGGLVARAVVEDQAYKAAAVRQLIMLAPPNHGSKLAVLGSGLDVCQYIASPERRQQARLLYGSIEDGLAEAAHDLRPDSPFLRRLNQLPRNDSVDYTILLGSKAFVNDSELELLRSTIQATAKRSRGARLLAPKMVSWVRELDEVVDGRGDGAVALRRGALEGVEDLQVLHFGHLELLDDDPSPAVRQLDEIVLDRLNRHRNGAPAVGP